MKLFFNFFGMFLLSTVVNNNCNHSTKTHPIESAQVHTKLQDTRWELLSLMGNEIAARDTMVGRKAFIILNKDGSANGNGGCNTFGGSYILTDSSQIKFGPIVSTKMFCSNAKDENLFFDLLSKTDNFLIEKDTLYLRNKPLDSIAKFIAVMPKKKSI
jgi:heat shock protein HslJ